MPGVLIWGWDEDNDEWVKVRVNSDGKLELASLEDAEVSQDTPEDLKHVPHGYYSAGPSYLPLAVDSAGRLRIELSSLANLNDIVDVSVASPTDGYVLYWDAGTSLWKCKAISGTKIQDADGDTKVDTEESADEDKIRMDVAGVEAFLLHDDGILDLAKQSRARGYRSAAQSIPDSTYTKVEIDTEVFDEQNELDVATNHRFTASVAGYYYCYGIVTLVNLGDGKKIIVAIYVNGTNAGYARTTVGGTDYAGMAASIVQYLEANDYVELYVYHNHGAALNVSPHTHSVALGVHKLS